MLWVINMSGSRRDINHAVNPWPKLNNQWKPMMEESMDQSITIG